jgi:S-formylglutathione hydrolase
MLAAAMLLASCGGSPAAPTSAGTGTPGATSSASTAALTSPGTADCAPITNGAAYQMSSCQVDAPSLAGNMLGDPASLSAYILTPADYATSGLRYPVVYVLAGYTDPGTGLAYSLAAAPQAGGGKVDPIVVVVSGVNSFGGGFYVNSPVTGNWEDAISKDLVGYVDAAYRTIAKPSSRGIAGHSMGGFGAVNAAMHHPEIFGALFAESAGLFDDDGAQARLGDPAAVQQVLAIQQQVSGLSPADAAAQLKTSTAVGESVQIEFAYGAAFAPDPASPALMKFPFRSENGQTVRDDALWAMWAAGFGGLPAKVQQCRSNLERLAGIVVDYGTQDEYAWIPKGDHYFVGLLQSAGIGVVETTFEGGHNDQVGSRLVTQMLPFMEAKLSAG